MLSVSVDMPTFRPTTAQRPVASWDFRVLGFSPIRGCMTLPIAIPIARAIHAVALPRAEHAAGLTHLEVDDAGTWTAATIAL